MQPVAAQPELRLGYDMSGVKPWTVLRQDSTAWQERKKQLTAQYRLDDRAGRPDATIYHGAKTKTHQRISGGGSSFDPVLAEAMIRWYTPPGGLVIDPFAGGPTRGVIADACGRHYHGIDLMQGQIDANRRSHPGPVWECGDAASVLPGLPEESADAAFTCPPYWDLERYSDDQADLSTMTLDQFLDAHASIIAATARCLRQDTFAVWVIGDKRDAHGHLAGLPWHTIDAFRDAGMPLVNDHILVTPIGSRFWTLGRTFRQTRTASRLHQYVLVFVKGDRRAATSKITREAAETC